jgi:hypothetical protein
MMLLTETQLSSEAAPAGQLSTTVSRPAPAYLRILFCSLCAYYFAVFVQNSARLISPVLPTPSTSILQLFISVHGPHPLIFRAFSYSVNADAAEE